MSRAIGVDLGTRRIGIAISDPKRTLATPYAVLHRSSDEHDARAVVEIMRAEDATEIVVGLPLSLDGSKGDAALVAEAFADKLKIAGARVRTWDERMSTVEAEKALRATGMKGRARRAAIDRSAATVILQAYLDAHRKPAPAPARKPSPAARATKPKTNGRAKPPARAPKPKAARKRS